MKHVKKRLQSCAAGLAMLASPAFAFEVDGQLELLHFHQNWTGEQYTSQQANGSVDASIFSFGNSGSVGVQIDGHNTFVTYPPDKYSPSGATAHVYLALSEGTKVGAFRGFEYWPDDDSRYSHHGVEFITQVQTAQVEAVVAKRGNSPFATVSVKLDDIIKDWEFGVTYTYFDWGSEPSNGLRLSVGRAFSDATSLSFEAGLVSRPASELDSVFVLRLNHKLGKGRSFGTRDLFSNFGN